MEKTKNISAIQLLAKRWFQKSYGNTYHSIKLSIIYKDGSTEQLQSGKHYGYGDQWNQTALDLFAKHFDIDVPKYENGQKKFSYLTTLCRELLIPIQSEALDVSREKDL